MRAEGWIAGELVNEDFTAETPAKWGTLVHGSASHGEGVYLRDLGNGTRVLTMVTWA